MSWTAGAIAGLYKQTPVRELMIQSIEQTGRLWFGLPTGKGIEVTPEDIAAVNAALDEGGIYSLVLSWATTTGTNETLAVCMYEAGTLEIVETTGGRRMMLLDGLTFEEAKAATRVWVGLQPQLSSAVRRACR